MVGSKWSVALDFKSQCSMSMSLSKWPFFVKSLNSKAGPKNKSITISRVFFYELWNECKNMILPLPLTLAPRLSSLALMTHLLARLWLWHRTPPSQYYPATHVSEAGVQLKHEHEKPLLAPRCIMMHLRWTDRRTLHTVYTQTSSLGHWAFFLGHKPFL